MSRDWQQYGENALGSSDGSSGNQNTTQMIGGIGGLLSNLFMKNPGQAGMDYYNQIPGMIKPYFNPYIQEGRGDLSALHGQVMGMLNDPSAILAQIGSHYHQSPGYQFGVDQATQGANRAAAAGGMAGSPAEQQQLAGHIDQLANQDYGNYMNRALGLHSQGLQGLQGLNQMGYNAATGLAGDLATNQMNMGNLAQQEAKARNAQTGGIFSGLGNILGPLAHFL
jgi:hypothetical protein